MAEGHYVHNSPSSINERRVQAVLQAAEEEAVDYMDSLPRYDLTGPCIVDRTRSIFHTAKFKATAILIFSALFIGYIVYMNTGARRALAEVEEYYERVHGIKVEARLENGEIEIYR